LNNSNIIINTRIESGLKKKIVIDVNISHHLERADIVHGTQLCTSKAKKNQVSFY